jgi:hypothetical protein
MSLFLLDQGLIVCVEQIRDAEITSAPLFHTSREYFRRRGGVVCLNIDIIPSTVLTLVESTYDRKHSRLRAHTIESTHDRNTYL